MMKHILLFITIILVLTSCNTKNNLDENNTEPPQQEVFSEAPETSVSQSYEPEGQTESEAVSSEEGVDIFSVKERKSDPDYWLFDGAVYCKPGIDYQQGLKHPLIEAVPRLHPVASEFMNADGEAFASKYKDLNELYKQGVQYKLKGMSRAYYDMLDTIRFGANCKAEVIGGLHVGDSAARMRELFGEPHFYNEELKLSGYRFPDFYLICVGEDGITEISMTKYRQLPDEYQNIVSEYMNHKMPIQMGIPNEVAALYPDNIYYYPGGFWQILLYDNGILFAMSMSDEGYHFLVWNNYEGEILTDTPNTLQFMDEDMYFDQMSGYYEREQTIFERSDIAASPDGNIAAFPNNASRPVEGDQIHIRWRDKSHCDITFWTRHMQSDLLWLNNRYLLFNVYMSEPAYFDTLQNKVYSLREAAGIPVVDENGWEREVNYERLDGNKLLWNGSLQWSEEPQYIINYSFDKDGNILFKAERSD